MIGLALLAPLSSFAEENGANKKKPNIIYILADDLGISELGCYGQQLIDRKSTRLNSSHPSSSRMPSSA